MKFTSLLLISILLFFSLSYAVQGSQPKFSIPSDLVNLFDRVVESVTKKYGGSQCVMEYIAALKDSTHFLELFDASGKIPDGILQGDFMSWGSFDACKALPTDHYCLFSAKIASINKTPSNSTKIFKKRLSTSIKTASNTTSGISLSELPAFSWGLCVPNSCSESDLQAVAEFIKTVVNETFHYELSFSQEQFTCIPKYTLDAGSIVVIFVFSLLGALVILSTIFDLYYPHLLARKKALEEEKSLLKEEAQTEKKEEKPSRVLNLLRSFSLIHNLPRLLNTNTKGQITCLNGVRVLSICWVMIGHTYDWSLPLIKNPATQLALAKKMSFQFVTNAWFSVDSFLFLSGFLLAYLTIRELNRKGRMPWLLFYFHRFWRLTPVYLFVILLFWKLNVFWVDGPSSLPMTPEADVCATYWWTNMLYINNFYPGRDNMCVGASWYLAIDMQYFALSPILLLTYYKSRIAGWILTFLLLLGSWIATAIITYKYNFKGDTVENFLDPNSNYMDAYYNKPYTRVSPYLVGFITAYIYLALQERRDKEAAAAASANQLIVNDEDSNLARLPAPTPVPAPRKDDLNIHLEPHVANGIMGSSILVMILLLYCTYTSTNYGWNTVTDIIYATFSRFIWGIGLAMMVFVCATGNGGWVNRILSHHVFTILSKLTYSTYLVHSLVLNALFYNFNEPIYYHDFLWMTYSAGTISISFACALVLVLLVEMPVINLEKVLLGH